MNFLVIYWLHRLSLKMKNKGHFFGELNPVETLYIWVMSSLSILSICIMKTIKTDQSRMCTTVFPKLWETLLYKYSAINKTYFSFLLIKTVYYAFFQQVVIGGPNPVELNCPHCQWRVATQVESFTDNSSQYILAAVLCIVG